MKRIFAVAVAAARVVAATPRLAWRCHCRVVARFEQGNPRPNRPNRRSDGRGGPRKCSPWGLVLLRVGELDDPQ